ncbi:MAG: protein-methionine-sulfoxide reductase catalytic subunit MsrP, partial [Acidobacteriota bacterium]
MSNLRVPPSWALPERLATTESVYWNRRQVVRALGLGSLAAALPVGARAATTVDPATRPAVRDRFGRRFPAARAKGFTLGDDRSMTPEAVASKVNNFYEFTTTKDKVWELAQDYEVDAWSVKIHGEVAKPKTLDLDALFTKFPL